MKASIRDVGNYENICTPRDGCYCEGDIRGVVLALVNTMNSDTSLEQSVGSADKTLFVLS